ncbi:MAG: hypothetical protein LBR97_04595, partial [Dysgonamonadaceae bacterium]|nr:hypothetical protein [Dysgonamonadaceae bacterium]
MKMKTFSFIVCFLCTFFLGALALSQDWNWNKHRETVIGHPDLIRYYVIDDSVAKTKIIRNL